MSRKRTKERGKAGGKTGGRISTDDSALSSNPFAAALGGIGGVDAGPEPEATPQTVPVRDSDTTPEHAALDLGRRAIVRRQSKGQGGKTVTCVEGVPVSTLKAWLPRLKKELGCGGRIQEDMLVLGTRDHARVAAWLEGAGVPRITLGN